MNLHSHYSATTDIDAHFHQVYPDMGEGFWGAVSFVPFKLMEGIKVRDDIIVSLRKRENEP